MSDVPQPDPDPTQTFEIPDDRLSELERQVVAQFVASDEVLPPPDASSGTASSPPTPPEDGSETSGVEGGGGEGDVVASAPPPTTATTPPDVSEPLDDDEVPLSDWDPDDQARARALVTWANQLTEEASAQVDAVLSGNYALVPLEDVPAITAFYQARQSGQTGTPPPAQAPAPAWEEDPDRETDPRFDQLEARLNQTEAQVVQGQQTAALEQARQEINGGVDEWFDAHAYLSADDRARLESWLIESGAYMQHASRYPPRQAVQYALTQGLAVDPVVAQRRIDAQVAERLQQERDALASQTRQNAGSSALAGSGSVMAPGRTPLDPDAAMVDQIRQAMQNGA